MKNKRKKPMRKKNDGNEPMFAKKKKSRLGSRSALFFAGVMLFFSALFFAGIIFGDKFLMMVKGETIGTFNLSEGTKTNLNTYTTIPTNTTTGTPTTTTAIPNTTSTSITKSQTITTIPEPSAAIIYPTSGSEIKAENFKIKIEAKYAYLVEFFVQKDNSASQLYLGKGIKETGDIWGLNINTREKTPNGDYVLVAKIKSYYGAYEADPVKFKVNLSGSSAATTNTNTTATTATPTSVTAVTSNSVTSANSTSVTTATPTATSTAGSTTTPIPAATATGEIKTTQENLDEYGKTQSNEYQKETEQYVDSDNDGVPNSEEIRRNTNPFLADSDQDGYLDGDEIRSGFDPLKFSPGDRRDKVVFQNPKELGAVSEKYQVEKVELVQKEKEKTVRISGKAIPNSFVTVYIFSNDPIIVTVKTNENGDWSYELDKELEDGNHEVYVAVTDNTGKITAKSEPIKFIKTAEAVSVVSSFNNAAEAAEQIQAPTSKSKKDIILFAIAAVAFFISLALALIGVITSHKRYSNERSD